MNIESIRGSLKRLDEKMIRQESIEGAFYLNAGTAKVKKLCNCGYKDNVHKQLRPMFKAIRKTKKIYVRFLKIAKLTKGKSLTW